MDSNMGYLIAAYTSIWVVLGIYIFVLLLRNQRLTRQLEELEERIGELERARAQGAGPPR